MYFLYGCINFGSLWQEGCDENCLVVCLFRAHILTPCLGEESEEPLLMGRVFQGSYYDLLPRKSKKLKWSVSRYFRLFLWKIHSEQLKFSFREFYEQTSLSIFRYRFRLVNDYADIVLALSFLQTKVNTVKLIIDKIQRVTSYWKQTDDPRLIFPHSLKFNVVIIYQHFREKCSYSAEWNIQYIVQCTWHMYNLYFAYGKCVHCTFEYNLYM